MIIKRVDEASFHRRPWGVLEEYLNDRKFGAPRRIFVQRLAPNELLALVSKNGMQVIFVRGFDEINGNQALSFFQVQLERPWTLEMLQHYVKTSKLPFRIDNYKSFEDIFPVAARAAEAIVKRGAR
jgi:hypothetical protein